MGAPAILDANAASVLDRLNKLAAYDRHHVVTGLEVSDGGLSQGSGAGTALNFDVDVTAGHARVNGVDVLNTSTATDVDSGAGISFGATSGKSVVYGVVFNNGAGNATPGWKAVPGAVADTGSQVPPTDAQIEAAVGHANWKRLADVTVNRTGDTTVTSSIDNAVKWSGRPDYTAAVAFPTSDVR